MTPEPSSVEQRLQPHVDVRATSGDREVPARVADRSLHDRARIDEVGLDEAVNARACGAELRVRVALHLRILHADVDDAAGVAAEVRAEVARVEVDVVEHLRGDDARETTEVIDDRHERAVDVRARLLRRRAAHDEQTREAGRARDAGKVLDRAERVAVRARECARARVARACASSPRAAGVVHAT